MKATSVESVSARNIDRQHPPSGMMARLVHAFDPSQRHDTFMTIVALCLPLMLVLNTFENNSRVGRIIFSAIPLLLLGWEWWQGRLSLKALGPLRWGVAAVLGSSLLSCFFSIAPDYSLKEFSDSHLWFGLLFLAVGLWATTRLRQMIFLRGLMAAAGVSALLGVVMYYFAFKLAAMGLLAKPEDFVYVAHDATGNTYFRARGMLESYTRSSMVLVLGFPATVALLVFAFRERRYSEALLAALIVALTIWYMLLTKSRGGWVAAGLAGFLTFLLVRGRWWLALVPAGGLLAGLAAMPAVRARASTFIQDLNNPDLLLSGRLDLWSQGVEPIQNHFITGVGYGADIFLTDEGIDRYELFSAGVRQPDLHSIYLQTLAEVGIVGLTAYAVLILMLIVMGVMVLRRDWHNQELPGVAVALASLAAILLSGVIYYYNEANVAHTVWTTMGLIAGGWARLYGKVVESRCGAARREEGGSAEEASSPARGAPLHPLPPEPEEAGRDAKKAAISSSKS